MDRQKLYLMTLALFNNIAVAALAALGEARLDAYVSVFVLIYFTLTAVFRPRKRTWDVLGASLLAVFAYIVFTRVLEVLMTP